MVHDCRMHPDLQHAFLSNHCFPVPCFDENTSTEELCRDVQLDEVRPRCQQLQHFCNRPCIWLGCLQPFHSTDNMDIWLMLQLFELAANGGHGTVCMFGQTGSGE
jgi:hypothetical protein